MLRHWESLPLIQRKEITRRLEAGEVVKHFDDILGPNGEVKRPGCPQLWPISKPFWEAYTGLTRTPSFGGYGPIETSSKLMWLDHLGLREQGIREAYLSMWSALDAELYRFAEEQEEARKSTKGK